ncbi:hypothetical protein OROMI_015871 [Orobanche minor]
MRARLMRWALRCSTPSFIRNATQTLHSDDYHNPTYAGSTTGCPREPWHDLHCKIDGPAAYDVLCNFEERWLKASKPHGIKKLKISYDDALLRIERMPEILGLADAPCVSDHDSEGWHVFRSIDSNSVKGFLKVPKETAERNLVCGKNVLIDMSIHTAYVKAIRPAQHCIYIENQYFIGSSYKCSQYKDVGANNLIPMEIALKIAEKIKAHQRFAAYIVIPASPHEGSKTVEPSRRIYGYRMSLWAEHIDFLEECFTRPDSLEFVRRVRSLGEAKWELFSSPQVSEMKGHLIKYPVDVDRKGKVKPLHGFETFADVGGNIVGSFLAIQENITI